MEVPPPSAASRYDDLLRQIVQLNADLQKTAALSQALQRERDGLQHNNSKLRDETKRLTERCDKLQLIESDKRHGELIAKWKRQLEAKARAFESLQKKFAPPRDLGQLRFQIQEELEGPHQQRVEGLQDEVEKFRQIAFSLRRECEVVKTEYEQFSADQSSEIESVHATYEMTIDDLKRRLGEAEERAQDAKNAELVRQLEHYKQAAVVEIKLLQDELRDAREELVGAHERAQQEKSESAMRLADELSKNATVELDCKALSRQMTKLRDESEAYRSKWDASQSKLHDLSCECEGLRDQVKQKDALVLASHHSSAAKLREERATWEKEQTALKDRVHELANKLQAAEALAQKASADAARARENDASVAEMTALLKAREDEVEKYRRHAAELEKKIAHREDELRQAQNDAEESIHRLQVESESLRKSLQGLETEKEHYAGKQSSSQELLARMKSECIMLRAKLKEVESDYRALQTKHREVIQFQEDVQLEKEQMETKLKYVEQDLALLAEKREKEKELHASASRDFERKLVGLEAEFGSQRAALKHEMRAALSKALRELVKTQKKRDAYKRKCVEAHERFKALVERVSAQEAKLQQLQHAHSAELQRVLAQLSEAESDKTALMQRQAAIGILPLSAVTTTTGGG